MAGQFDNLRITLYGVQGSGSVFPSRAERKEIQQLLEFRLLEQVFADLQRHVDSDGRINCTVEQILGGQPDFDTLLAYRRRFHVEDARIYGGWTTCIRVETAEGDEIIFDLGSGFRHCASDLQSKWGSAAERELYIFGSHSHMDHTEGFDQAAVCFDPRNQIRVYGNRQFLRALDQNLGVFTHEVDDEVKGTQTPLHFELMPARFESCEIRDMSVEQDMSEHDRLAHTYHDLHQPIHIGATTITAFQVYHPAPCLAYRVQHGERTFVFCTDHELRHGEHPQHPRQIESLAAEARLKELAFGADVMYRDGQFRRCEYDGREGIGNSTGVPRIDWGHSCVEDITEMATACQIKTTYIGHHDPNREWAERNAIDEDLMRRSDQSGLRFELARAETVIDL